MQDPNSAAAYTKKPNLRERILTALAMHGACTAEELTGIIGANPNSVRGRIKELIEAGEIHRPGDTKLTSSGQEAWVVKLGPGESKHREQGPAEGDRLTALEGFARKILYTLDNGRLRGEAVEGVRAALTRLGITK